jgi:hypothetical protein
MFSPVRILSNDFFNQHSIHMYDRRLFAVFRVKLLEILLKNALVLVLLYITALAPNTATTSFPGSSLLLRKDPGWGWSRVKRKFDRPRGSRQSIKLHASTSALYTSIARSECFVPINFENHICFKILAKFDLCLLLNYNNMLNRFL